MTIALKSMCLCSLAIFIGANSAAAANDYFRCDRITASNFDLIDKSAAGVDKMYPKELKVVIASDKSWAASYYGIDTDRSKSERKNDIVLTKNGFRLDGTKLRKTGALYVHFYKPGYKQGSPAVYECDKPTKTSWKPKD
jgi:hypothetical protein